MSDSKWVPSKDFEDEISDMQENADSEDEISDVQENADFEDEIQAMQPECDSTFENYGDDPSNIFFKRLNSYETRNEIPDRRRDLNLVQKITNKYSSVFERPIGRQMTPEDLENNNTRERETILMLRKHGVHPSIDEKLDSKLTIPAITSEKQFTKGRLPMLYDETFFQLRPRNSISSSSGTKSDKSSSTVSSSAEAEITCVTVENNSGSINISDWLKKTPKRKIAAKLNGVPAKDIHQNISDVKAIRKSMKFITPFERYKQKRQRDNRE